MSGDDPARTPSPWALVGLGFEMIVPVVLLMLAGRWLDARLGSEPWLLLVGAILGMTVGFYNVFRRVIQPGQGNGDTDR